MSVEENATTAAVVATRSGSDDETQADANQDKKDTARRQEKDRAAKRPRWGDKAFEDIKMSDIEQLVRRCNSLEKKVESNSEVANQLKELQDEKKDLEKQLVDSEKGSEVVAHVKSSISKQLLSQMIYMSEWASELKEGRSIVAYVPNVSQELLKSLGGSATQAKVDKRASWYFPSPLTKALPSNSKKQADRSTSAPHALVLGPSLTLKYIKTTSELQVSTTYRLGHRDKAKGSAKGKAKNKGKEGKNANKAEAKHTAEGSVGKDGEESDDDISEEAGGDGGDEDAVADTNAEEEEAEEDKRGAASAPPPKVVEAPMTVLGGEGGMFAALGM